MTSYVCLRVLVKDKEDKQGILKNKWLKFESLVIDMSALQQKCELEQDGLL